MAKPQGNDCYIDCFVVSDPELKGLFYRRAKAVYEVDMDTGYILAGEYYCSRFNFMPPLFSLAQYSAPQKNLPTTNLS